MPKPRTKGGIINWLVNDLRRASYNLTERLYRESVVENYAETSGKIPALHRASTAKMIEMLLSQGARVNRRDFSGNSALHCIAAQKQRKEPAHSENHFQVPPCYQERASAQDSGIWWSNKQVKKIRVLLKHGAVVDARNNDGYTPLYYAVNGRNRNVEVIEEFLKYRADVHIPDYETPLDYAMNNNKTPEVAKLMVKYALVNENWTDPNEVVYIDDYGHCKFYDEISSYMNGCLQEISAMKVHKLDDDGLQLYDVVTTETKENKYSLEWAKKDYSVQYPIYHDIIVDRIKPFIARSELVAELEKINFRTNLDAQNAVTLDFASTYIIAKYLTNEDLFNLIEAFRE